MRTTRTTFVALTALGVLVLAACGSDDNSSSTTVATPTTAAAGATPTTAAAGSATTAAAGGSATTAAAGAEVTGSLDAADQTSDGTELTVKSVTINGAAGFIAAVTFGDGDVKLDSKVATGAFWPMLHLDAGTKGTYEFPGPDGPVKSGADIVMKKITLTVG